MESTVKIIKDKKELIEHLELPAEYYAEDLPESIQSQITKAKAKERSEIPTYLWNKNKYSEINCLTEILNNFNKDDLERRVYSELSIEEFREKYEKKKIPLIITGVTDEWRKNYEWTWSVG